MYIAHHFILYGLIPLSLELITSNGGLCVIVAGLIIIKWRENLFLDLTISALMMMRSD